MRWLIIYRWWVISAIGAGLSLGCFAMLQRADQHLQQAMIDAGFYRPVDPALVHAIRVWAAAFAVVAFMLFGLLVWRLCDWLGRRPGKRLVGFDVILAVKS